MDFYQPVTGGGKRLADLAPKPDWEETGNKKIQKRPNQAAWLLTQQRKGKLLPGMPSGQEAPT